MHKIGRISSHNESYQEVLWINRTESPMTEEIVYISEPRWSSSTMELYEKGLNDFFTSSTLQTKNQHPFPQCWTKSWTAFA